MSTPFDSGPLTQGKASVEDWLSAINAVSDLVMILDLDHTILAVNHAILQLTNLPEQEIVGRYCYEVFHHSNQPPENCPHKALLHSRSPQTAVIEMELLDRMYMVTAAPILDNQGRIIRTIFTAKDVTEQDSGKKELLRINRALTTIIEGKKVLAEPSDEQELLTQLCRVIVENGGYSLAWVGLAVNDPAKTVKPVAQWGHDVSYVEKTSIVWADADRGRGPTGSAIRTGRPAICNNILTDPQFAPWKEEAAKHGYFSSVALPLILDGQTIGSLNIYASEPDSFDDKEVNLLNSLAADLTSAISTRRIQDERQITALELARRTSEWSNAMDFIEDAIYLVDLDNTVLQANKSFYKMTGLTPEKTIGQDINSIMHPNGEAIPCPVCLASKQRRDAFITMDADHPDNPIGLPIRVMVKTIRDDQGEPISILMGIHDLSPMEELRKHGQIINQINEAVIATDLNGLVTTWNNGAEMLLGYTREEAVGKSISQILPAADIQFNAADLFRNRNQSHSPMFETRIHKKDGSGFYALISSASLRNQTGEIIGTTLTITDINDRKTAEIKLQKSEERFRTLTENTSDWIWEFDENNILTYVSSKIKDLLGYEPSEIIGKNVLDLMSADETKHEVQQFGTIVATQKPFTGLINANRHKDSHTVILESSGVPIFDADGNYRGYWGVGRDITERRQNEKIKENQARMWALGSDIGQAMAVGKDLQEMLQKCCEAIVLHLDAAFARIWIHDPVTNMLLLKGSAGMYTHLDGPHSRIPVDSTSKIGQIAFAKTAILTNQVLGDPQITDQQWAKEQGMQAYAGHPLLVGDKLVGAMSMFSKSPLSDFTLKILETVAERIALGIDRYLAEQEKGNLQKQMRQLQKMEAIGTLAGGIAHDFNNILTAIIGFSDLLRFEIGDNTRAQESVSQVIQAGQRARELVKQILTFSRQTEHSRQPLQTHLIIKEAMKLLKASIPSTIEVRQDIDPECWPIMADPTEIHQIMMNLCTNAYQCMQEKGGVLEVLLENVFINTETARVHPHLQEGNYARLTVTDTGSGIDSDVIERIFEPYFTTKKMGDGTGMGLAVVHGIVQSLGGTIVVNTKKGQGSSFQVFLPSLTQGSAATAPAVQMEIPKGRERILFVDDEEQIVDFGQMVLSWLGYEVTTRTNPLDAFQLVQDDPYRFDLLITDQIMPKMTGTELSKAVTAIRPDLPVILITGFSNTFPHDQVKKHGIRENVMKPLLTNEIAQIVRKVLDQH